VARERRAQATLDLAAAIDADLERPDDKRLLHEIAMPLGTVLARWSGRIADDTEHFAEMSRRWTARLESRAGGRTQVVGTSSPRVAEAAAGGSVSRDERAPKRGLRGVGW